MIQVLSITSQAQADIDEHAAYLDDHARNDGERFLTELAHVFDRLVAFPAFGQPCPTEHHRKLRRVILPSFPVSVFYRSSTTSVEVLRVLHHARDLSPLLDEI